MSLSLIARQLQRETQAADEAVKRMHDRRRVAAENNYASSNIESRKAIARFTMPIAELLKKRMFTLRRGKAALDAETVVNHLKDADLETLTLIGFKTLCDVLGKESEPQCQELTTKIGANVQMELRLEYYAAENPDLYKQAERFFHAATGTRQRATVLKIKFNREGIIWEPWPNSVNHKVGTWILMAINDVTGWLDRCTDRPGGGRKTRSRISYTEKFLQHRDTILAAAESLAFCQWPMLCPPVDWSNDHNGGYLSEQIRRVNPLVRRAGKVEGLKQGDMPLAMLNTLQRQSYRVDLDILDIANVFYDQFKSVGKFVRESPQPDPAPIAENACDEDVKAYKRKRRETEDFNAQLAQKNWRTTEVMYVARKYAPEAEWWCPASFDYRGRVYFLNTALNPQGTDFDKALIRFSEEGPVSEPWLSFHLSNCYGHDKETMEFRKAWASQNRSLINRIASDPVGTVGEWESLSEPWCFIAAAMEYKACCIDKTRTTSGIMCGIDATCSGLQHLAAMTRCGDTAALVNVTPTDQPADAYKTVAEATKRHLPVEYREWMNRRVSKRPVMCTPYGVTMSSARGYIRDQLFKDGHKAEMKGTSALTDITRAMFQEAIPEVLPGPIQVMAWLKRSATKILQTNSVIRWTSPSGFVVVQDLKVPRMVRLQTRIMGGARVDIHVGDGWTDEPDKAHHRSALAPNVVHANDAALIHLTFALWERPFSVIHDCVMGRSCDMQDMGEEIRLHFAEMYKRPVMQEWADEVGVDLPRDLIKNTLDIESVNQSPYFFS